MAKRIYVGGLPYSATKEELESIFSPHGEVSDVHIVTDRATGQSRGFGFVEMANDSEALTAISVLNGTSMAGRRITVNEAREREPRRW